MTAGQDGMIARHPYLNGGVWSDQSYQRKGTKEVSQLWNKVYQRAFSHIKTTSQVVLADPDYFYSL